MKVFYLFLILVFIYLLKKKILLCLELLPSWEALILRMLENFADVFSIPVQKPTKMTSSHVCKFEQKPLQNMENIF